MINPTTAHETDTIASSEQSKHVLGFGSLWNLRGLVDYNDPLVSAYYNYPLSMITRQAKLILFSNTSFLILERRQEMYGQMTGTVQHPALRLRLILLQ